MTDEEKRTRAKELLPKIKDNSATVAEVNEVVAVLVELGL